ncbi:hypothetical protein WN944_003087 [Citrus x changshan-huyou]|uniref:Uncharacterized protein n=2 Tax=Citrus TaxID=2706 RepID=A0A2H5Q306_CITUN|nr:hypothetical protein CUMW_191430 [Citrus unshiu]
MARRKMWWVVPCTNISGKRSCLRTESMKSIEDILKTKLATIKEEPSAEEYSCLTPSTLRRLAKKDKAKIFRSKAKMARLFLPQFISLKHSLSACS